MKLKIKHSIFGILLFLTIIPMIGFSTYLIVENNKKTEHLMTESLEVAVAAHVLDIENFNENIKENMRVISRLDVVLEGIRASIEKGQLMSEKENKYVRNMLTSRTTGNEFVESISIIDRNFRVITSSSEEYTPGEISNLRDAKAEFLTGEAVFSGVLPAASRGNKKKCVSGIVGIFDDQELIGYVVVEINMLFFEQLRTQGALWKGGTLYLLDQDSQLMTAGTSSEESREEFVSSAEERADYNRKWSQVDLEKEPQGKIMYTVLGQEYITYYAVIPGTSWHLLLTANLSEVEKKKETYAVTVGCILILGVIMFLLLNWIISKKLTRPVEKIVETLRKIQEEENYKLRIEAVGRDEMGRMAGEINLLLDYIEREDIEKKKRHKYLAEKAERDPLTGLYNKRTVEKKIEEMILKSRERGEQPALCIIDIDDFKEYNTNYGHAGGDQVLIYLAETLKSEAGTVAGRIGGDEFILGLETVKDRAALKRRLKRLLKKLNAGFKEKQDSRQIQIFCSMGAVVLDKGEASYEEVFSMADKALYQAKEAGKNTCRVKKETEAREVETEEVKKK